MVDDSTQTSMLASPLPPSFLDIYSLSMSYILLFWEFFTPVWADGFSLEFEWLQVSSSLQDSS